MREDKSKKKPILADHKRKGKVLVPPLIEAVKPLTLIRWVDVLLPEILWLAIINNFLGKVRGFELSVFLAQQAMKVKSSNNKFCFFSSTSFSSLTSEQQKKLILNINETNELDDLRNALSGFIFLYPECPLNFLYDKNCQVKIDIAEYTKGYKELLNSLYDKRSVPAIFMQANALCIAMATGKMKIMKGSGLDNFTDIEQYPKTDTSKQVAASICASMTILCRFEENTWPKYFWNRGLELEPCKEVGYYK